MRKDILTGILLAVLLVGLLLANDLRVRTNNLGTNKNSTLFRIQGTSADTSKEMDKYPVMTFSYFAYDSTGTDSINLTVSWQILGAGGWQTVKTLTVSTDSIQSYWNITDEAVPPADKHRLIVTGNTGNKVGSYSCIELRFHNDK